MTTKYDPQAAGTALHQLDELKTRRTALLDELRPLTDRVQAAKSKGESADTGTLERMQNLTRGLDKLNAAIDDSEKSWSDQILAGYNAGELVDDMGRRINPQAMQHGSNSRSPITNSIVDQLVKAKFDPRTNPSVRIDGHEAFTKGQTLPTFADWQRRAPVVVPLGQDDRFMWNALQVDGLRPEETSIQDFKITAATVTGTIERAPSAVTTKADLATTTSLVNEAVKQFAITISDIPNQLFQSVKMLADYMSQQAEFELQKALDTHVYNQIVAASPPFGNSGTGLMAQIRKGVTTMKATGATPSLLVLNPTDSETLDTTTTADGIFLLTDPKTGGAGDTPVWSMRRVERIGAGTEPPYLIDPSMLGVLYLGGIQIDADPYTGFKTNTTNLRLEFNALFHVRNANGARRIAAS